MKTMRWKAFHFLKPPKKQNEKREYFGFNSTKPAPIIPELKEFEKGLLNLIQNVEFDIKTSDFQNMLKKDVKDIKADY